MNKAVVLCAVWGSPASILFIPSVPTKHTLRELIHLFKYNQIRPLAQPLGALMARAIPREHRFDLIIPMPLHWKKRWSRGYNQSELLAKEVARRWGVPVRKIVRRVKPTAPQAGLRIRSGG